MRKRTRLMSTISLNPHVVEVVLAVRSKEFTHEKIDKSHNPRCLRPFKCSIFSTVMDVSKEDFNTVIYKKTDEPLETLQTWFEEFYNDVCCICTPRNVCTCKPSWECPGYCLCINNCEHQAVKSMIGTSYSHQVSKLCNKYCLYVAEMKHIYFLQIMLLMCTLLDFIDTDFLLKMDLLIHIASFLGVFVTQIVSLIKSIQEQERLGN